MEQDIGILLNKLNNLVANMSISLVRMPDDSLRDLSHGIGVLGISVNLTTRTSTIEDSIRNNLKVRPPSPFNETSEPIIDVLDNPDSLKIIAHLPGVRKEDVSFNLKEGMVELEIKKSGQIYRKEIPCKVRPTEIITKSVNYNNSILEIIFKKKANR